MDALAVTEYDKGFVVPVTSPDHPVNTNPSAASAVRVIVVFRAYEPPEEFTLPPSDADTEIV